MFVLEKLLGDISIEVFKRDSLSQRPVAKPGTAREYYKLIGWDLLAEIFATHYKDCWLVNRGQLTQPSATGQLTIESAQAGFSRGETIVIRHSEKAHSGLNKIAREFAAGFAAPVDIQLYCTPEAQEGFDWHYDIEDVFVIQSSGQKEFSLRKNVALEKPSSVIIPKNLKELEALSEGPEFKCLLKAGDFLYIPAGYWHKARALTPSFHLSVGVRLP